MATEDDDDGDDDDDDDDDADDDDDGDDDDDADAVVLTQRSFPESCDCASAATAWPTEPFPQIVCCFPCGAVAEKTADCCPPATARLCLRLPSSLLPSFLPSLPIEFTQRPTSQGPSGQEATHAVWNMMPQHDDAVVAACNAVRRASHT